MALRPGEAPVASALPAFDENGHPVGGRILKEERRVLVWQEAATDGETGAVTKLYRRGNLLSELRYRASSYRVEREWRVLAHLAEHDIPCTEPLHWYRMRHPDWGFCQGLSMRRVPGGNSLRFAVLDHEIATAGLDLLPMYRLIARMHESGIIHGALWTENILIDPRDDENGIEFFMSDMPRALIYPGSVRGTRMAWFDLLDLSHSVLDIGLPVEPRYLEVCGLDRSERERFLELLPAHIPHKMYHRRRDLENKLRLLSARLKPGTGWKKSSATPAPRDSRDRGGGRPGRS